MPTYNLAVGRMVSPNACTVWILPNGKLATASHCFDGPTLSGEVEFNIPPLPGIVDPDDRYSIITSTIEREYHGDEIDYAVFEVEPNPNTGLYPIQRQGASIPMLNQVPAINSYLIVTGCGLDAGEPTHLTQQTADPGPLLAIIGHEIRYDVYTNGANSGSPIILADGIHAGSAIGVHHSEECHDPKYYAIGTAFTYGPLWELANTPGIILDQQDENEQRLGLVTRWTGSEFEPGVVPPFAFYETEEQTFTPRADQRLLSSKKYHRWNELTEIPNVQNHQTFSILCAPS